VEGEHLYIHKTV